MISVSLWQQYIVQVDLAKLVLQNHFPFVDFNSSICSRKRNALSELVKNNLQLQELDAALSSIIDMISLEQICHDTDEQWKLCIRSMALHACDTGRIDWLCSVPNVVLGDISISNSILLELEVIATQFSVAHGIDGKKSECSYYECLLCLISHQNNYGNLSLHAMAFRDRLLYDPDGRMGELLHFPQAMLSMAIHALSCLEYEHAYVIARGDSVLHNSLPSIQKEFVTTVCAALVDGYDLPQDEKITGLLNRLITICAFDEAFSLLDCHSYFLPSAAATAASGAFNRLVESMADMYSMASSSHQAKNVPYKTLHSRYRKNAEPLECDILSEISFDYAHDTLLTLRNSKGVNAYDIFSSRILKHPQKIPGSLKCIFSTGSMKCNSLRFFLNSLLERGLLSEACYMAENYFVSLALGPSQPTEMDTVPFNAIDRLILSCDFVIQNAGKDNIHIAPFGAFDFASLQISSCRLKSTIENYFIGIHAAELQ
jgi:hypothetical protein